MENCRKFSFLDDPILDELIFDDFSKNISPFEGIFKIAALTMGFPFGRVNQNYCLPKTRYTKDETDLSDPHRGLMLPEQNLSFSVQVVLMLLAFTQPKDFFIDTRLVSVPLNPQQ